MNNKIIGKIFLAGSLVALLAAGCNSNKTVTDQTPVQQNQTNADQASSAPASSTQTTPSTPATPSSTAPSTPVKSDTITYQGQDGKTALELLKATHKVETQNYSGVGEFVKSIDGITPDKSHFWGFYVNGKSSNVGAGDYKSKSTDKLEWKLDTIGDYKS